MIITVKNFGKISSASINLGDYNVFVGENNSGKTFLMQLIYGIINFLSNIRFYDLKINDEIMTLFSNDDVKVTNSELLIIERWINQNLSEYKERIVIQTFNKEIPIEDLNISFNTEKCNYIIKNELKVIDEEIQGSKSHNKKYSIKSDENIITQIIFFPPFSKNEMMKMFLNIIIKHLLNENHNMEASVTTLFLPASRSGLMLLYNHFFERRKNKYDAIFDDNLNKADNYNENEYGLTKPVYDFLNFLQKYKISENNSDKNKEIIKFINDYLIKGTLKKDGNTMMYVPNGSDFGVPSFLSSSIVNEISPVMQLLTGINKYKYIFYDEIETCQHPLTQIQMARLLVRMVNAGYKMIVSTHSGTMAAAINNLIMLSFINNNEEKAHKMGYTSDDLLKTQNIHAYQFTDTDNGTIVEELENFLEIGIGFDFELFNKSNKKIINDTNIILE